MNAPVNSQLFQPHRSTTFVTRRAFLAGAASTVAGGLLAGCAGQPRSSLTVHLLKGSVPPQLLTEFRKVLKQKPSLSNSALEFTPEPQLEMLFALLQGWEQQRRSPAKPTGWLPFAQPRSSDVSDLVMLGDYWLEAAIQQKLIQPLDPKSLPAWQQLPTTPDWRGLVARNSQGQLDPKGQVWAAPYRWSTTVIAYRQDIFQEKGLAPPTDWGDLWRADLRRHLSLLDQPREVIGLTLKKLGKSYNTPDLTAVPALMSELTALQQQVKLYSSDSYLQPLLLGDTWLAVGWSTDVLSIAQRSSNIRIVVPTSGTALSADLWVRPAASNADASLLQEWINFCWQPEIASRLSLLSRATSPMLSGAAPDTLPNDLRRNAVLLPDAAVLRASDFLLPLPPATLKQYQTIGQTLRQTSDSDR